MWEDISNLLNNGEVPNLYPIEEKAKIVEEISQFVTSGTNNQKYAYFINKCKENLHLLLCMSPFANTFRKRLRNFPSLVNCTSIDWFLPWPQDALSSTAFHNIQDIQFNSMSEQSNTMIKEGVVNLMIEMQMQSILLAKRLEHEYRRFYYITPTNYLSLISTFRKMYYERLAEIEAQTSRYE